jgi:hypothetical protein
MRIPLGSTKFPIVPWGEGCDKGYWAVSKTKQVMVGVARACQMMKEPRDVPPVWFSYVQEPDSEEEAGPCTPLHPAPRVFITTLWYQFHGCM